MVTVTTPYKKHRLPKGSIQFVAGTLVGCFISTLINSVPCSIIRGEDNVFIADSARRLTTQMGHISTSSSVSSFNSQTPALGSSTALTNTNCYSDSNDGWKLIHVFYGDSKLLPHVSKVSADYFKSVHWFSQARQDEVVSSLLKYKKNGYFVDLASNDAIKISNTYALETNYDWNGLCLEPNSEYWPGLAFRKCDVAGVVIGSHSMQEIRFDFNRRAPAKGGLVGKEFDIKKTRNAHEEEPRFTNTILDVFERFGTPNVIDYMSLDVEGAEEYIMEGFPYEHYRINVLTVERPSKKLQADLKSHGYQELMKLKRWGEFVWVHIDAVSSLNMSALEIETESYQYRET